MRHTLGQRAAADIEAIGNRLPTPGGIDHQLNFAGLDRVHAMGAAFQHLIYYFAGEASFADAGGRAAGGHHAEAHFGKAAGEGNRRALVRFLDGDEGSAGFRQLHPGAKLGFQEGALKRNIKAHDFPGGFHLRAQDHIHIGEAVEGEDRFLHRDMPIDGVIIQFEFGKPGAGHDPRADLGDFHPGRLGHEGHGARCARIYFQHIDFAILHRVLHIHQPLHFQRSGHGNRLRLQFSDNGGRQGIGRQGTGGIAGMDARFFNMFHHAGDMHIAIFIRDAIHIHFNGIDQILINQDRVFAGDFHRFHAKAHELFTVIGDFHRPPAQHVRRPHHNGVADAFSGLGRFFQRAHRAIARLLKAKPLQQLLEAFTVFGDINRLRAGAQDGNARLVQSLAELERRLPAILHNAAEQFAGFLFLADERNNIFRRQRFEIEPI